MGNDDEEDSNGAQTIDTVNTLSYLSAFVRVLALECPSLFFNQILHREQQRLIFRQTRVLGW